MPLKTVYLLIDNIESIGDSCHNLEKALVRKKETKIEFPQDITDNILKMFTLIDKALEEMLNNLNKDYGDVDISKAFNFEIEINNFRNYLREDHIKNIKSKKCKYKAGVLYNELFSTCEKLGDYVINVSESIRDSQIS